MSDVQEKDHLEQIISYVLSSFYSVYYKADTSNGLIKYDCFKICTTDLNFLKLIQINFTAPVMELQMVQCHH